MYSLYGGYGASEAQSMSSVVDSTFTNSAMQSSTSLQNSAIWLIVALVIAVIGGIVLYFTFLRRKNEGRFTGFLEWLYEFLGFKKFLSEALLKISYLIVALYITLSSFAMISYSFLGFLAYLIFGNIVVRLIYEFLLIALVNCRNTTEINKKLSKLVDSKKEEPKE